MGKENIGIYDVCIDFNSLSLVESVIEYVFSGG